MIKSPLSVQVSGKLKFILNLNNYRNAHYFTLNKAKVLYKEAILEQVDTLPIYGSISLMYTLFPKSKRLCDLDNVLSIHAKFFQDALVEAKKIQEDNYLFVKSTSFKFGTIDKHNPRVEINITEEPT